MRKWLLITLLIASCSDDDRTDSGRDGGTGPSTMTLEQVAEKILEWQCHALLECKDDHDDDILFAAQMKSAQDCKDKYRRAMEYRRWLVDVQRTIAANKMRFNGEAAARCFGPLRTTCAEITNPCPEMFEGLVAIGEPCFRSEECVADGWCDHVDPFTKQCPGTCRERSPITGACTEDEGCTKKGVLDSVCYGDICYEIVQATDGDVGESCAWTTDDTAKKETQRACKTGLWCNNETCAAPIPANGACTRTGDVCIDGYFCSNNTTCQEYIVRFNVGEDCDESTFAGPACSRLDLLICGSNNKCAAFAERQPGSACQPGDDFGLMCPTEQYCDTDTCKPRLTTNATCTDDRACDSGSCEGGTCLERQCL